MCARSCRTQALDSERGPALRQRPVRAQHAPRLQVWSISGRVAAGGHCSLAGDTNAQRGTHAQEYLPLGGEGVRGWTPEWLGRGAALKGTGQESVRA